WLNQFEEVDQPYAQLLIQKLQWVSSHEFQVKIKNEIYSLFNNDKIALFVEREVSNGETVYKFASERPRRAIGSAFPPINNGINSNHEVGSEGILNNIATTLQRSNSQNFFYYPSAEKIRAKKINKVIILTDTIASGNQIRKFLEAFAQTPSIESWHSSGYISFYIVCYAITENALDFVSKHKLKPQINYVCVCPTISNSFNPIEQKKIREICNKYNPNKRSDPPFAVGYGDVGSLIYYEHGIPNNAPEILYKRSEKWFPLFRGRTTIDFSEQLPTNIKSLDTEDYLNLMKDKNIVVSKKFSNLSEKGKSYILVLFSLKKPPRSVRAISKKTKLSSSSVTDIIVNLRYLEWIDDYNRITDEGYLLIKYLKKNESNNVTILPNIDKKEYYPTSLRRP
ncbi:hypothetical protein I1Y23_09250, partial [Acinetobacter baumannii]